MILEIITPEKQLFNGEVNSIKVPGTIGDFEILNNHAPIISSLKEGEIRIISIDNKVEKFQINGGVIEMKKNKIIVLAD
ncbi:MAG: ATP synthase F1 subunit epsilon [Bacteroidota bacterium]|nr:ATP synthase F1 subunit epsilon [Bacteroidota bacterium]|tara:strand:- start:2865 stop:3101 length:237 start_codon:yes stop_codon:yes gene_type:complete